MTPSFIRFSSSVRVGFMIHELRIRLWFLKHSVHTQSKNKPP